MAKRKQFTFERLPLAQKLNRQERREVEQRSNATHPPLEIVNPDAAVPPKRDPPAVREFGSWTAALV